MPDTTIAVVTALTPSPTTLAEYGLHFLTALGRKPGVRVVALVEDLPVTYPDIDGVEIRRAWRFGSVGNPLSILRAARAIRADVVIVNAHFTSFGSSKPAAALGLMTPALLRLSGIPVVTLLHNIMETVDLGAAGFRSNRAGEALVRAVGWCLTRMILTSNLVTTTMPRYVEILRRRYRAGNVALTPHGSFATAAAPPASTPTRTILTFGKFGTYKKVEGLIRAFRLLDRPELRLVIAGTDSPNTPGYLHAVADELGGPDVDFLGYVPEEEVEPLFRNAVLTVFPYTATTGSSGVLHQAGAFGCPPVLPRIGDLEDLIEEEGFTGSFFEPGNDADLARAMGELLDDPDRREDVVRHNRVAATGLPLEDVVDWYLLHIGSILSRDPRMLLADSPVAAMA